MKKNLNIEVWMVDFLKDKDLYVLRDIKTHKPYNVSYSPEGLMWTTSKEGKLLCFKNAVLDRSSKRFLNIKGDTTLSEEVYIDKYTPLNHKSRYIQYIEYTWCNKALKLIYNTDIF